MRLLSLLLVVLCTGCATLIHGSSQDVQIESEPSEARVEVNGRPVGETPTTATLDRNRTHTVMIYLEGYEPYSLTLRKGKSYWSAFNLLNGLIPGLLVDASTGALYSLDPDPVQATLAEETAAMSGRALRIQVALQVDTELPKIGQLQPK